MLIQSSFEDIVTPTGIMRTFVHQPLQKGPFPSVLFYSEIFQQTGPIERAAQLVASHGYNVIVPEVFHELNPIGTILGYDDAGREKGNKDKSEKDVEGYDSDNQALIDWLKKQSWHNGNIGAMGFCIGGHLAFRAALNPEVKATACYYATDLHTQIIPNKPGNHSMDRLDDINGQLLMIWGKQDNHVPKDALSEIRNRLLETNIMFEWHEFNAKHAFMRDEGDRYDGELAAMCYQMTYRFFTRNFT